MRRISQSAMLALALGGCSLYFGESADDTGSSEGSGFVDGGVMATPDAMLPQCTLYYCSDGTIYELDPVSVNPDYLGCQDPDYSTAVPVATCEYGCRYENLYQGGPGPCASPPPPVYTCEETGACSVGQTQDCGAPFACGQLVQTGTCTCDANGWSCEPACSDGLCSPAAVQQAIVGTWTGTVTTEFEFMPTYQTTLTVAANGDWTATGNAFYYGGNGGTLGSTIFVQAQTSLGAYGVVRLFNASVDGLLTGIRVDSHHLRFTFVDSWLGCGRSFSFDLHR